MRELRAFAAEFVNGISNLRVELDGRPVHNIRRTQSGLFAVALPEDNVLDAPCAAFGGHPAGIFYPTVDDGIYVTIDTIRVGMHTLPFSTCWCM